MRSWLPAQEHHRTLTSLQTEISTWLPSHGSVVVVRWGVSVYRQFSVGELLFAGYLLCIHCGLMIHTDSKQVSCVVRLIYILAITSLKIILYSFILPCHPLHLFRDLPGFRVLKRNSNWSFSYCYLWSPGLRKTDLLQLSVCVICTYTNLPWYSHSAQDMASTQKELEECQLTFIMFPEHLGKVGKNR